ncbi:MAG: hypothetical protein DCC65_11310 [Planctomycetota bacterium]|nr:MAG: hypothetical protein DCC65_11310 [Planctomycetota bacterium]
MSRASYLFAAFPWDLTDEGPDAALARLAGELGVDGVTVAVVHPGIHELRGRPLGGRWAFRCGAAAHFQPDAPRYAAARIRPITAAWMKSRNPLEHIARIAERERLRLRVSIDPCRGRELVERFSHAACMDLFGEASDTRLCPSNPEVRAYIAALAEDLVSNYPVEAVELAGADFGDPSQARSLADSGVDLPPADRVLFSWCFCAACRQRAADSGVSAEAAAAVLQDRLAAAARLEMRDHATFADVIAGCPELAAYQRVRAESVTSLVRSVKAKCPYRVVYLLDGDLTASGVDPVALADACDALNTSFDAGHRSTELSAGHGAVLRKSVEVRLTCRPPLAPDGPALVARTHEASQAGFDSITFENYGLTPEPCLDWVRQAVRYARRETRH